MKNLVVVLAVLFLATSAPAAGDMSSVPPPRNDSGFLGVKSPMCAQTVNCIATMANLVSTVDPGYSRFTPDASYFRHESPSDQEARAALDSIMGQQCGARVQTAWKETVISGQIGRGVACRDGLAMVVGVKDGIVAFYPFRP